MGSNYPVPTNLVLLPALPHVAEGVKVRFLGSVRKFDLTTGSLILEHQTVTPEGAAVTRSHKEAASPPPPSAEPPSWIYSPNKRAKTVAMSGPRHEQVLAVLDVALVTEDLARDQGIVEVGSWVHVTGYVGAATTAIETWDTSWEDADITDDEEHLVKEVKVCRVRVQAQLVWEAKGLDLARYERAVHARQDAGPARTIGST